MRQAHSKARLAPAEKSIAKSTRLYGPFGHRLIGEPNHALRRGADEQFLEPALARSSDDREIGVLGSHPVQDNREGIADHNLHAHARLSGLGQSGRSENSAGTVIWRISCRVAPPEMVSRLREREHAGMDVYADKVSRY